MKERISSTIDIKRGSETLINVPITERCVRRFMLMEEDYVRLSFTLMDAVGIRIGDYIEDDIFGKFVVTKEQMPKYSPTNGGYEYDIQFDAEYMSWNNRMLALTNIVDDVRVRKETQWYLTAELQTQAQEVINNIECLGFFGYSIDIDVTASKAKEVKLMSYNATGIIDALNEMAEKWECEWWIQDKVIHFGKCEEDEEPMLFENGSNVASMEIQDNRNSYASKVFVYGSSQNIPATYRKDLTLKIDGIRQSHSHTVIDTDKKLTGDMFPALEGVSTSILRYSFQPEHSQDKKTWTMNGLKSFAEVKKDGSYRITAESLTFNTVNIVTPMADGETSPYVVKTKATAQLCLEKEGVVVVLSEGEYDMSVTLQQDAPISTLPRVTIPETNNAIELSSGTYYVFMRMIVTSDHAIQNISELHGYPSTTTYIYIGQSGHGSGIIKVHGVRIAEEDKQLTLRNGRYMVGSNEPIMDTEYQASQKIEIDNMKSYSMLIAADSRTSAITFFKRTGSAIDKAVGWIAGRSSVSGVPVMFKWSSAEHSDADYFIICTMKKYADQGITIRSTGIAWTSYMMVNYMGVEKYDSNIEYNPDFNALTFCNQYGDEIPAPEGLEIGSTITIDKESETVYVPWSFYSSDYDNPSALSRIGETRLQLPEDTNGYLLLEGTDEANAVEEVVAFEDIYPRCNLIVDSISEAEKTDRKEYDGDGSTSDWQWTEYTLKLRKADGGDFPFKEEYILPHTNLQIKFLTPEDMGWDTKEGCSLAGMTFDVSYDRTGDYTIIRNDEYGAMLPNEILRPKIGDPCVLIGWNSKAISGLGLVSDAEQRLSEKGAEYMSALEEGQFTFECTMIADFMFDIIPYLPLYESGGKRMLDSTGSFIYVKNGYNAYLIPREGAKVTIRHGALKSDKQSRVIGYELKLDKPYDAPRYTIGETQAYSRLAKIEREIKRLN